MNTKDEFLNISSAASTVRDYSIENEQEILPATIRLTSAVCIIVAGGGIGAAQIAISEISAINPSSATIGVYLDSGGYTSAGAVAYDGEELPPASSILGSKTARNSESADVVNDFVNIEYLSPQIIAAIVLGALSPIAITKIIRLTSHKLHSFRRAIDEAATQIHLLPAPLSAAERLEQNADWTPPTEVTGLSSNPLEETLNKIDTQQIVRAGNEIQRWLDTIQEQRDKIAANRICYVKLVDTIQKWLAKANLYRAQERLTPLYKFSENVNHCELKIQESMATVQRLLPSELRA